MTTDLEEHDIDYVDYANLVKLHGQNFNGGFLFRLVKATDQVIPDPQPGIVDRLQPVEGVIS